MYIFAIFQLHVLFATWVFDILVIVEYTNMYRVLSIYTNNKTTVVN